MENFNNGQVPNQTQNNTEYQQPRQQYYYQQIPPQYSAYYQAPQKPKRNINKGLVVFLAILLLAVVFGSSAFTSYLVKNSLSSNNSADATDPSKSYSDEFDSIDEDALKPGVDSGNNDLKIPLKKNNGKALTAAEIAEKSKNSVLGISVYGTDGILKGEASGIVAGENSKKTKTYIVTCSHVLVDSGEDSVFKIVDANGKEYLAAVIGYDISCDVGVLSVEKTGFSAASFGDSSALKAGETVVAIGNPGGSEFYGSVTQGIVSATDRMVVSSDSSISCIQHDAAINPGSSGGALFDKYGMVVGINYSKISADDYEGMNFAVPSKTAVEKANKIIAQGIKTKGVKIGIEYYVSASYFDDNYKQLVINSIDEHSDLYGKASEGDFIIAVDGEKITDKYTIIEKIQQKSAGDEIVLTIAHKNPKTDDYETKDVSVKLIEK